MNRNAIKKKVESAFGMLPGWMSAMPDPVLEQYWGSLSWARAAIAAPDRNPVRFRIASAHAWRDNGRVRLLVRT